MTNTPSAHTLDPAVIDAIKLELQPTRDRALELLDEWQTAADVAHPILQLALAAYGENHNPNMERYITELHTVLTDGRAAFTNVIALIDGFAPHDYYQGLHVHLPERVEQARNNTVYVQNLVEKIESFIG